MDKELSTRWLTLPEVRVEFSVILTVDTRLVSLPDITPDILSDYIQLGQKDIDAHLAVLAETETLGDRPRDRPSLLIGRLALSGSEDRALTKRGSKVKTAGDIGIEDLREAYRGYWRAIDQAMYIPQVYRDIVPGSPVLGGAWLGLRRP